MDPRERIDLMLREVERLEARARRMSVACLRHMRAVELADIRASHEEEVRAAAKRVGQRVLEEFERQAFLGIFGYYPSPNTHYYG